MTKRALLRYRERDVSELLRPRALENPSDYLRIRGTGGSPAKRSKQAISATSDAPGLDGTQEAGKTAGPAPWLARAATRLLLDGRIAFPVLGALLATRLATQLGGLINHDTGWYLHSAARFLDGSRLYDEIFVEVNPPLGLFLTLPPVALSRLSGLFVVDLFVLYLYALIGLSLAATWWLLRGAPDLPVSLRRGLVFAAALVLTVSPAGQFGQREHFLMVLALPYLILAALGSTGAPRRPPVALGVAVGVGVAAALGFALKPHYLSVPLALEVYLLAGHREVRRLFRPETLALAATGALYVASVIAFTPDYLTRIVPYALEVYNAAYRNPPSFVFGRVETILLPMACLAHLAGRGGLVRPAFCDVFFAASACLFLSYGIQMKGWDYQVYPATACLVLGFAALCLDGLESGRGATEARPAARPSPGFILAALAAVFLLVGAAAIRGGYRNILMETMMPHVETHAPGGSIAAFTSNVLLSFPMVNYAGVGWSSRLPAQWLLPGVLRKRQANKDVESALLDEIERYTRDAVVADFTRQPPDLVIVDNRERKSYFGDLRFDYLDYFMQDPRFAAIWAGYEWVADESVYRLYRRRCAPAC